MRAYFFLQLSFVFVHMIHIALIIGDHFTPQLSSFVHLCFSSHAYPGDICLDSFHSVGYLFSSILQGSVKTPSDSLHILHMMKVMIVLQALLADLLVAGDAEPLGRGQVSAAPLLVPIQ